MSAHPAAQRTIPLRVQRGPFPLTRAAALERWRGGVVVTIAAEAMVAGGAATRHAAGTTGGSGWVDAALFWVVGVVAIPLLLLWATAFSERSLMTRPPKRLLAYQAGTFFLGSGLVTGLLVRELQGVESAAFFPVAGTVLAASLLPLAAWFASALLTIPEE